MKTCKECQKELPANHTRRFCDDACMTANIEAYVGKPYSQKKRWYGPVPPLPRKYKKPDLVLKADRDMQRIARLEKHPNNRSISFN